jgi:hypothetical protein
LVPGGHHAGQVGGPAQGQHAAEFGPKALKACRSEMVKKDWSRNYVNAQVDRVRREDARGEAEEARVSR